jgi:hypothetical protein
MNPSLSPKMLKHHFGTTLKQNDIILSIRNSYRSGKALQFDCGRGGNKKGPRMGAF